MSQDAPRATDLDMAIRAAWMDLNLDMVAVLGGMPDSRKLAMVGSLADFARQSYAIQMQADFPDADEAELRQRVTERMLGRDAA